MPYQSKTYIQKYYPREFWEDGKIGSTRNVFSYLERNCTGRICLMYLFWNSRVY